jgi:hypothetical protein
LFVADIDKLSHETLVFGLHLGASGRTPILVKGRNVGLDIHEDGLFAVSNIVLHFLQGRVQDILFGFGYGTSCRRIKSLTVDAQARKLESQREYAGSPHGHLDWIGHKDLGQYTNANGLML